MDRLTQLDHEEINIKDTSTSSGACRGRERY